MTAPVLLFQVPGDPVPQGSKRVVRGRLIEANSTKLRPWRGSITAAAMQALPPQWDPFAAFHLTVHADYARPKSHYTTKQRLRSGAPVRKTSKPDLDKVVRAVADALTDAHVWVDDSHVIELHAYKRWGVSGRVLIQVQQAPGSNAGGGTGPAEDKEQPPVTVTGPAHQPPATENWGTY